MCGALLCVTTLWYCHDMATTQRSVRVVDEKWKRFTAFCHSIGTDASKRLNDYIDNDLRDQQVEDTEGSKRA